MKTYIHLKKVNDMVGRIEALEFHSVETKTEAALLKHLLMCQCLNAYGLKTANSLIEIWEKYNNRKAA